MITETKREKERKRDQEGEERQIDEEKDRVVRYEGGGGGDGHVLHLDTIVKYGVLVRVGGGVVRASVKKLDLKKMIEELDLYEVQSMFICLSERERVFLCLSLIPLLLYQVLLLSQMFVVTVDLPNDVISLHLHQLGIAFHLHCQSLLSMRISFVVGND